MSPAAPGTQACRGQGTQTSVAWELTVQGEESAGKEVDQQHSRKSKCCGESEGGRRVGDLAEGNSGTGNSWYKSPEAGRCCLRSRNRQEAGVAGAEQAGRASTEAAIFIFYSKRRGSRESEGANQKTSPACPSPHKPWWPEATLCKALGNTPGALKQHGALPPSLRGRDHRCAHSADEDTAALSWVTHGAGFQTALAPLWNPGSSIRKP